jgi:hypothetical protein
VPLRAAQGDRHWRAGARVGLPLPQLQEALGKRLRGAGAVAEGDCPDRRALEELRHGCRQWQPGHLPLLHCGSDVYYEIDGKFNDLIAIPLGAFDDPYFASPSFSVWEARKHDWVEISSDVQHSP